MAFSDSVWERETFGQTGEMSKNAFAALVSFWTAAGIAASCWAATISIHWQLDWLLLLGVLAVSILGIFISFKSDNPVISLFGYALVVIPFGLMMGPVVAHYTKASVINVLFITGSVVVVLGFIGAIYPKSLESWGIYLFGGLTALLIGQFGLIGAAAMGLPIKTTMHWMDWFGVALFSGYVIFDMNRAMRIERTHDNAIDCAVAIYLDFANLFIRLLELTGQKSDD